MIKIDMKMPSSCFNCPLSIKGYRKGVYPGQNGVYPESNDYTFTCIVLKSRDFSANDFSDKVRLDDCPLCPETAADDKDVISRRHLKKQMLEVVNAELEDKKIGGKIEVERYFFTLGRLFGLLFAEPSLGELKEGAKK